MAPFFARAAALHGWTDRPAPAPFVPPPVPVPAPSPTPAPAPTPRPVGPWNPSRGQLIAFEGNLAVYCPEIKPEDYRVSRGIRGIDAGWFWLNWLWRLPKALRPNVYAAIKRAGGTHFCQNTSVEEGPGYHGLAPTTREDVDRYGAIVTEILDEAEAERLIVIGAAANLPLASGLDGSRFRVALNCWDDSCRLWEDLKAVAANCPNALIYLELPGPRKDEKTGEWIYWPEPCGGDEPIEPGPTTGGAWLRAAERRFPNFMGVLHELGAPDDIDANVEYLQAANRFWRDKQQVLFETDLYWILQAGRSPEESRAYNDELRRRTPWLVGQMGGATPLPPADETPIVGDARALTGRDDIPIEDVTFVGGPDIGAFARTAAITKIELTRTTFRVSFTKQDGPGRWIGRVLDEKTGDNFQFSIGLALKVNGHWYAAAPIEAWHGQENLGDPIHRQHLAGADKPEYGQIAQNWFNYARFAPLQGVQPQPGDEIGLFVCSGDARNNLCGECERSNIVRFALPPDGASMSIEWK